MLKKLVWIVPLVGFFVWRNERVLRHSFILPPFNKGFFAAGLYEEDCSPLGNPANAAFQSLKYCEDETFWDIRNKDNKLEQRHLLLSCDPNRKSWNTVMGPLRDPNPRGNLWLLTLDPYKDDAEKKAPVQVSLEGYPADHDFHPLGLEIYPSRGGKPSNLFVVNHARARTTIEQFVLDPSNPASAKYIRTLTSPHFTAPNAIALTSPTSFYVSNDHLMTRRLPYGLGHVLPVAETILALPLGWVAHVSLKANKTHPSAEPRLVHTVVAPSIPFANGVALSPDGSEVAIASTTLAQVIFYKRNAKNNKLERTDTVLMPFMPDNIAYDDSNTLIVTGHANTPRLLSLAANRTAAVSPSWVVSVQRRQVYEDEVKPEGAAPRLFAESQEYDMQAPVSASGRAPAMNSHVVETLFQSDGTGFSSASTGLRDASSGNLYITGLYAEEGAIVCRAKHLDTDLGEEENDDSIDVAEEPDA
ncbi:hypothetical protein HGRIS_003998 [Hohenbuehelia grisea]|uniref:Serum paraoxonase/arylesterase n=1 Tax=Hohenbuehelia grisea TaxID=104357 RepID=A0ABR3JH86_9AGAR